jgi:hypothetical protein
VPWTELRVLIVDTGRVWWRLLPIIIGVYLLGWLGSELSLRVAVILGDISPWLTLIMFAFSFVCTLAAAIVILTLAGRELGIRQLLPEDEREIDDPRHQHHPATRDYLVAVPRHVRRIRPSS